MDCVKCGAPLPPRSNVCGYCGALNDVDLRAVTRHVKQGPAGDRVCPRCDVLMQTVDLQVGGHVYIERCENCLGIFFDPGELETLIDGAVSPAHEVDYQRITTIIEEESLKRRPTRTYVNCPVCRRLMNRKNYGSRSGVVVDVCKDHGVWLDGGELSQLFKWVKAGGLIHADERNEEEERLERLREERQRIEGGSSRVGSIGADAEYHTDTVLFAGLLGSLARMLR